MIRSFLLISIALFVVELWGLLTVGKWIGPGYTILLVLLTGIAGLWLARREGWQTLNLFKLQVAKGEVPGQAVLDGFCILLGAVLLLPPGFFTDAIGLLLLIPYTRNIVKAWLRKMLEKWIRKGHFIIIRR